MNFSIFRPFPHFFLDEQRSVAKGQRVGSQLQRIFHTTGCRLLGQIGSIIGPDRRLTDRCSTIGSGPNVSSAAHRRESDFFYRLRRRRLDAADMVKLYKKDQKRSDYATSFARMARGQINICGPHFSPASFPIKARFEGRARTVASLKRNSPYCLRGTILDS